MDIPELLKVRDLLVSKYTKSILPDREIGVYPRLVLKLSMSYPEKELCEKYLEAIADNFGVDWCVDEDEEAEEVKSLDILKSSANSQLNVNSRGNSISSLSSASPSPVSSIASSHESLPPPPYSDFKTHLPMDYSKQQSQQQQQPLPQQPKQNLPDFDEFTKRFEALRKK